MLLQTKLLSVPVIAASLLWRIALADEETATDVTVDEEQTTTSTTTTTTTTTESESSLMSGISGILGPSHFEKDFGFNIGVKTWVNEWSMPVKYTPAPPITGIAIPQLDRISDFESSTETVLMPAFNVRYHNFFMGGSFFPEKTYKFSEQTYQNVIAIDNNELVAQQAASLKPTAKRKELDFSLGYFILPGLGISAGYKNLDRDYDYIYDNAYFDPQGNEIATIGGTRGVKNKLSVEAFIVGLSGVAPLGKGLNLYGSMAYGWPDFEETETDLSENKYEYSGKYYLMEVGLNYGIPLDMSFISALNVTAGYRYQRLESEGRQNISAEDMSDIAQGFNLGIMASF